MPAKKKKAPKKKVTVAMLQRQLAEEIERREVAEATAEEYAYKIEQATKFNQETKPTAEREQVLLTLLLDVKAHLLSQEFNEAGGSLFQRISRLAI